MAWNNSAQAHAIRDTTLGSSFLYRFQTLLIVLRHLAVLEKIQNTIAGILIFITIAFIKEFCRGTVQDWSNTYLFIALLLQRK
jgi:hypothetical protein